MKKIINSISYCWKYLFPKQNPEVKGYSDFEYFLMLRYLSKLENDIKSKGYSGSFRIYTDPEKCISSAFELSDILNFDNPKVNSLICVEFFLPNGISQPLLVLRMGETICLMEQFRSLSNDEKKIFRNILPLEKSSKNFKKIFSIFSQKINFIVNFEVKKTKAEQIMLRENELSRLPKKENDNFVLNEKRRIGTIIKDLKIKFNEEYGPTYILD